MTDMLDESTPTRPARRSWWTVLRSILTRLGQALRRFFAPPPPIVEAPPDPAREVLQTFHRRYRIPQPLVLPSHGLILDFQIYIWVAWEATAVTEREFHACVQRFAPLVRREVDRRAGDVCRHFHVHQASELEVNLNRRIGRESLRYEWYGTSYYARPEVRVRFDEEIREQLKPVYLQRLRREREHEAAMRQAQLLDQLTRRWLDVVIRLREHPAAAQVAKLTDERLAAILGELVDERRTSIEELAARLQKAISDSNRVGEPLEQHEADEIIELLNDALRATPSATFATAADGSSNGRHRTSHR